MMTSTKRSSIGGKSGSKGSHDDPQVLDSELPVWLSEGDAHRLDNNFFHPAAHQAEQAIQELARAEQGQVLPLGSLLVEKPVTGASPTADGLIPLAEGRNLRPNYVVPLFGKFAEEVSVDIEVCDIVLGKDGEPGTAAAITEVLLEYTGDFTIGNHVYRLRLSDEYAQAAYFVTAFINTRLGQALIRKMIAGGTTPTLRKDELLEVHIYVPADRTLWERAKDDIIKIQTAVLASLANLGPSDAAIQRLGISDTLSRLPVNYVGGGRNDAHRYFRD